MPTKAPPPVPESLRLFLASQMERGDIDTQHVLAVLQVLSWAENEAQMRMYLGMLKAAFPFLQRYEDDAEGRSGEIVQWLTPILPRLIKDNPKLASSIMRRAAQPNITIADLRKEFPILESYSPKE